MLLLYLTAVSPFCVCGNSLSRSLECISLFYTCSHQDNKNFLVAPDTKHTMQVSSVLTEDHFMLSYDALGILNCYPQSPRNSQLRVKAHLHSLISKDQGQLPQCLVTGQAITNQAPEDSSFDGCWERRQLFASVDQHQKLG